MGVRLSLAMIVRDEEFFLPSFLDRHAAAFDDIVVVDTGSIDSSRSLLQAAGARVLTVPWKEDFSHARNMSLEHALGEWVFILDPDEFLDEADLPRIRALVDPDPPFDAVWFETRNYFNAGGVGFDTFEERVAREHRATWFGSRKVRLFRRLSDLRFKGPVHELLSVRALQARRYRVLGSQIPVHHYTNFRPAERRRHKTEGYIRLGLKKLLAEASPTAHFELSTAYLVTPRYDLAAWHLEQAVRRVPWLPDELGRIIGPEVAASWQKAVLRYWISEHQAQQTRQALLDFEGQELGRASVEQGPSFP